MEGEFRSLVKLLESQVQEAHTASFDVSNSGAKPSHVFDGAPG